MAGVFSSKFDAYFQNAFSKEHLWRATSVVRCSCCPLITLFHINRIQKPKK